MHQFLPSKRPGPRVGLGQWNADLLEIVEDIASHSHAYAERLAAMAPDDFCEMIVTSVAGCNAHLYESARDRVDSQFLAIYHGVLHRIAFAELEHICSTSKHLAEEANFVIQILHRAARHSRADKNLMNLVINAI